MSDYGPLVTFKSIDDFWCIERCGNKPNTVRFLAETEYLTRLDFARTCLACGEPATICMVNAATGAVFYRRLTSIEQIGTILGQTMWVLSWEHKNGAGFYTDQGEE